MRKESLPLSRVIIKSIEGDGNCLFRAISFQLYETDEYHEIIRSFCMDIVEINKNSYSSFMSDYPNVESYINEKRKPGVWGDNIEIQAMSELYHIPIYIYRLNHSFNDSIEGRDCTESYELFCKVLPNLKPQGDDQVSFEKMNTKSKTNNKPIRLLYYEDIHYDSLHYLEDDSGPIISTKIGVLEFFIFDVLRKMAFSEKLDTLIKTNERKKEDNGGRLVYDNKSLSYNAKNSLTGSGLSGTRLSNKTNKSGVVSNSFLVSGLRTFKHEKESNNIYCSGSTVNSKIHSDCYSDINREFDSDNTSYFQTEMDQNGIHNNDTVVKDLNIVQTRDIMARTAITSDTDSSKGEKNRYGNCSSCSDRTTNSRTNVITKNKNCKNEAAINTNRCYFAVSKDEFFSSCKNDYSSCKAIKSKMPAQCGTRINKSETDNKDIGLSDRRRKINGLMLKTPELLDGFQGTGAKCVAISCQELNYKYSIQNS
ncbi:cysteine protease [Cryptosporidium ryanae]|uniref:cysteine protease n=1 Tax=Cryptosporidium ryanae TaxID=515981 RepID=UPI00351A109B|nr:cysteine protease [Cryptosporidium ryanae]